MYIVVFLKICISVIFTEICVKYVVMHLSMLTPRGGGGRAYVGYLIINCIPTLGILISILAPSWGNLNRMTFINIVFIAIYCKMVGHLTNSYCPTVGHLIENLLKKSNAPPMPDPPPPPLGLNIDRSIIVDRYMNYFCD